MRQSQGHERRSAWRSGARRLHAPTRRGRSAHGPGPPVPPRPTRRGGPPPWALRLMRKRGARRALTLVLALVGLALMVAVSGARVARQEVGYVGVVRNGGPLDARTIRQVLLPGAKLTWIGFFSEAPHDYPAANVNRTYTVTSDAKRGSRAGVDVITVPTKDGVQLGIEATVFVRFVGESNIAALTRYDISYGTRKWRTPDGRELHPWEGDEGFFAWMDGMFRPILDYNLRREIGVFECAQLVASCSLVSRGATGRTGAPVDLARIARRISKALQSDLTRTLGQPYFRDIRMRISRITLPAGVQTAIDETQAKYAEVNAAEAELRQARFRAERNRLLGDEYNRSPGLATIDAMKAIPKGSTVILSPGGKVPTILAGAGNLLPDAGGRAPQASEQTPDGDTDTSTDTTDSTSDSTTQSTADNGNDSTAESTQDSTSDR